MHFSIISVSEIVFSCSSKRDPPNEWCKQERHLYLSSAEKVQKRVSQDWYSNLQVVRDPGSFFLSLLPYVCLTSILLAQDGSWGFFPFRQTSWESYAACPLHIVRYTLLPGKLGGAYLFWSALCLARNKYSISKKVLDMR